MEFDEDGDGMLSRDEVTAFAEDFLQRIPAFNSPGMPGGQPFQGQRPRQGFQGPGGQGFPRRPPPADGSPRNSRPQRPASTTRDASPASFTGELNGTGPRGPKAPRLRRGRSAARGPVPLARSQAKPEGRSRCERRAKHPSHVQRSEGEPEAALPALRVGERGASRGLTRRRSSQAEPGGRSRREVRARRSQGWRSRASGEAAPGSPRAAQPNARRAAPGSPSRPARGTPPKKPPCTASESPCR
jgi:hypothetical protein